MPRSASYDFEARFAERIEPSGDCLVWTGKRTSHGYGIAYREGREYIAHRVAWEIVNGPISDGMWVLHHCDNPPCVRLAHLFLGTHDDNMADAKAKGRIRNHAMLQPPTHCPSGHDYALYGRRSGAAGKLSCRLCVIARSRAYQASRRAASA